MNVDYFFIIPRCITHVWHFLITVFLVDFVIIDLMIDVHRSYNIGDI